MTVSPLTSPLNNYVLGVIWIIVTFVFMSERSCSDRRAGDSS